MWAVGVVGALATYGTTLGTVGAGIADGGIRVESGFDNTQIFDPTLASPAGDPQGQGVVSAVVLAFNPPITLEPTGTATVLCVTVELEEEMLEKNETRSATVSWKDGLVGKGQPTNNIATVDSNTVLYCACQQTAITFEAVIPQIEVDPMELQFGEVAVGESPDQSFEIRSVGEHTLTVESVEFVDDVDANCPEFSIVAGGGARTLEPGEVQPVTVRYTPVDGGEDVCLLRVVSNAVTLPVVVGADESVEVTLRGTGQEGTPFRRGDADTNGSLDLTDGIFILNYLFSGGRAPSCMESANTDNNLAIELTDAIAILQYLFLGAAPPTAPGPTDCGRDPEIGSPADLGCEHYPAGC